MNRYQIVIQQIKAGPVHVFVRSSGWGLRRMLADVRKRHTCAIYLEVTKLDDEKVSDDEKSLAVVRLHVQ